MQEDNETYETVEEKEMVEACSGAHDETKIAEFYEKYRALIKESANKHLEWKPKHRGITKKAISHDERKAKRKAQKSARRKNYK